MGSLGNPPCLHEEFCKVQDIITKLVAYSSIISQILRHASCPRRTDGAAGPGQGDRHTCHCPQDYQHGLFSKSFTLVKVFKKKGQVSFLI